MAFSSWDDVPDDVKNRLLQTINSGGTSGASGSSSSTTPASTPQSSLDPGGFSAGGGGGAPGGGATPVPSATPSASATTGAAPKQTPLDASNFFQGESDPAIRDLLQQMQEGNLPLGMDYEIGTQLNQPFDKNDPSYAGFTQQWMTPDNPMSGPDPNSGFNYGAAEVASGKNINGGQLGAYSGLGDTTGTAQLVGGNGDPNVNPMVANPSYNPKTEAEFQDLLAKYPVVPAPDNFGFMDVVESFAPVAAAALAPFTGGASVAALGAAEAGNDISQGNYTGAAINAAEGAAGAAGGAPDAAGAAAGGTLGEAGTSLAGDELATGVGSGASGDFGGAFGEAGTSFGDEVATGSATGAPGDAPGAAQSGPAVSGLSTSSTAGAPATSTSTTGFDMSGTIQGDTLSAPLQSPGTTDAGLGTGQDWGNMGMPDATPPPATVDPAVSTTDTAPFGGDQPIQGAINPDNTPAAATQNANLAGGSDSSTISNLLSKAGTYVGDHPLQALGVGTTAAGLLKQLTQGPTSAQKALDASAANATSIGNQLISQGQAGTLSPGMQANVDQASQQMKAQVRGQFASLGLSGSTMEADALNQVDTKISGMVQQYSANLISTGQSILNTGTSAYADIASAELAADTALQQAIGNFAGAAGGVAGLNKKAA